MKTGSSCLASTSVRPIVAAGTASGEPSTSTTSPVSVVIVLVVGRGSAEGSISGAGSTDSVDPNELSRVSTSARETGFFSGSFDFRENRPIRRALTGTGSAGGTGDASGGEEL